MALIVRKIAANFRRHNRCQENQSSDLLIFRVFLARQSAHAVPYQDWRLLELLSDMRNLFSDVSNPSSHELVVRELLGAVMLAPVQRMTVPACLGKIGQKMLPDPAAVASAVDEDEWMLTRGASRWRGALDAHALDSIFASIYHHAPSSRSLLIGRIRTQLSHAYSTEYVLARPLFFVRAQGIARRFHDRESLANLIVPDQAV